MMRPPSIVDELRREAPALRGGPGRDLVPAVRAALARERRVRRRRALPLVACAALALLAVLLPRNAPDAGAASSALALAPTAAPPRPAAAAAAPPWPLAARLDPGRLLDLGGAWWSGLEAPLRHELEGLTEDARRVASAVVRRLPDALAARLDG